MRTRSLLISLLSIVIAINHVQSAKILGVFSMPRSHYFLARVLMRGLAEHGNDVTVISVEGEKTPPNPKNGSYRDIVLDDLGKKMREEFEEINMFDMEDSNVIALTIFINTVVGQGTEEILKHPKVQKLINSDEKFDVVVVEQFMNDGLKALALHFKAPLVGFSSTIPNSWVNEIIGNPSPLSYVSNMHLSPPAKMSFRDRLLNTIYHIVELACTYFYQFPLQNKFIKKYIPDQDLYDVVYNSSLILVNSHPSYNQAVPTVPNLIQIGGFHVEPPKKLPKDLQEYLDGAKDGVIYFSMGSNLRSARLPVEKRDAILKAFGKRKEQVLWKWEDEVLPGKPDNVKIGKWLPQQDILAHPNVKLFITHGGLLSTTETVYHGVPILAIPIYGDQKTNAKIAVNNGIGLSLPYSELNEAALSLKLEELLENPKYSKAAKLTSNLFHDRPIKPLDEAVYWVEYVARHGGAPHLRVAGADLPWYKYHLLDVIAFLSIVVSISLYIHYKIAKLLIRKIFCKKNNKPVMTKLKSN